MRETHCPWCSQGVRVNESSRLVRHPNGDYACVGSGAGVLEAKRRTEKQVKPIKKTKGVCGGEACLAGTRIPVWVLVSMRRRGMTDPTIRSCYPNVQPDDLAAAWDYAASHKDDIDAAIKKNEED